MPKTLEQLIDELDKWVNFSNPTKDGKAVTHQAGLIIRYSTSKGKWVCNYSAHNTNPKHTGFGDTPIEAVQDKLNKLDMP